MNGHSVVAEGSAPPLLANADFVFDPLWLRLITESPESILTCDGVAVLAHVSDPRLSAAIVAAMRNSSACPVTSLKLYRAEDGYTLVNDELRKRERLFVQRLTPESVPGLERVTYAGAYKGVTDALTKYLWRGLAFHLTRLAAALGLSPNMVTAIGLLFCVFAGYAFWLGDYWAGMIAGFISMVLDTVDGKLARCTLTSSRIGNIFDHGIDLIHPPIWWWTWGMGLAHSATPLPGQQVGIAFAVILAAYVVQRLIEGAFIRSFGMHIHVWQKFDSCFRLITARRNPNMAILLCFLAAGRPDLGYLAITWWSGLCCLIHLVRLAQAYGYRASGRPVTSWLAA